MRSYSLLFSSLFLTTAGLLPAAAQDLTVYTYESFTAEWGLGPIVEKAFEAQCKCDLKFVAVADGVALLNRVKLEGKATKADVVLGLDTNLTADAEKSGLFVASGVDTSKLSVPGGWADKIFVPFDYGYFAVVYNSETLKNPPRKALKELVEGDPAEKIVIQDPRTSTPGLGLLLWVRSIYGDDAPAAWAKLSKRGADRTPGWSEAYGLITKGEAPMVLSYTTSPAYHVIAESTDKYKAAPFSDGHYLQVEVARHHHDRRGKSLAKQFLDFMTGPVFQDAIPETNWMFPGRRDEQAAQPGLRRAGQAGKDADLFAGGSGEEP